MLPASFVSVVWSDASVEQTADMSDDDQKGEQRVGGVLKRQVTRRGAKERLASAAVFSAVSRAFRTTVSLTGVQFLLKYSFP